MRVSLNHQVCLPATRALDRIEVDASHRKARGKCVTKVVEAEVRKIGGIESGSSVALQIVRMLAFRRAVGSLPLDALVMP